MTAAALSLIKTSLGMFLVGFFTRKALRLFSRFSTGSYEGG